MMTDPQILKKLIQQGSLLPKEEMLEIARKKGSLFIGIPKETSFQERRVALVPEAVTVLVANGHRVRIESKSGEASNFTDNEYSEAGAEICHNPKDIFECDIIFKVAPPSEEEVEMMRGNQTLISALQLSIQPKVILQKLMQKKITAIAWDYIRDEEGVFPVVRTMGEIAGTTSILVAGELLSSFSSGKGIMLGGIAGVTPTEVVVIGAGTVGEFATRAALGLGASVKVFDNSLSRLRRLQNNIGTRVHTSVLNPKVLAKSIKRADVIIGALRSPLGRTPCVVSEEMIQSMKSGSVAVDVSIDQGGCFEDSRPTTHEDPTYVVHNSIFYCVANMPGAVPVTSTYALTNVTLPFALDIANFGWEKAMKNSPDLAKGLNTHDGKVTFKAVAEAHGYEFAPIF